MTNTGAERRLTALLDQVRTVHQDDHLLVLDKPSGLPTTSPRGGEWCLVDLARRLDPDAPRLHPSSRLDRPVSGLVTFARTARGTQALLAARRAGSYHRTYLAVALPGPAPPSGRWTWTIDRDPRDDRLRRAVAEGEEARPRRRGEGGGAPLDRRRPRGRRPLPAETRFEVEARAGPGGGEAARLTLWPVTGRTHQLRVHAAQAGAPLFGDVAYGGARRQVLADGAVITARRVLLHCAEVTIPDPVTGAPITFRSPAPDDLEAVWSRLAG
ncbi:MAG TPA: RluA family pseudouridine synthase [Polyangiaceae bacterium LLY-WYZ-14_1]|nr:RluA family pseudouridine synthase [Polyangiaceae bacterium LLY-WYZ-14_1]